jgi:hypothetical protein
MPSLKPDFQNHADELRYFMNQVSDNGVIVSLSTAGSGVAMDAALNLVTVAANSSGAKPVGLLLDEVVNIDQTRFHINEHKRQANVGNKVAIMQKGWATTNAVLTATAGTAAVLASSGYVTNATDTNGLGNVTQPKVGKFKTNKDEDGFAVLYVDL